MNRLFQRNPQRLSTGKRPLRKRTRTVRANQTIHEDEIYLKAIETFIQYLDAKQADTFWLMANHALIEDMFRALCEEDDQEDLLPALRVLHRDPGFSAALDASLLDLVLNRSPIA